MKTRCSSFAVCFMPPEEEERYVRVICFDLDQLLVKHSIVNGPIWPHFLLYKRLVGRV